MTHRPNKIAADNCHRAFSFDEAMKFEHHYCSQAQSPVSVPELWRFGVRPGRWR